MTKARCTTRFFSTEINTATSTTEINTATNSRRVTWTSPRDPHGSFFRRSYKKQERTGKTLSALITDQAVHNYGLIQSTSSSPTTPIQKRQIKHKARIAKAEIPKQQSEARRLQAEAEAAELERAAFQGIEEEEDAQDSASLASFLSSARTACSSRPSATGMSGYTESLDGFMPPASDSSYEPSN